MKGPSEKQKKQIERTAERAAIVDFVLIIMFTFIADHYKDQLDPNFNQSVYSVLFSTLFLCVLITLIATWKRPTYKQLLKERELRASGTVEGRMARLTDSLKESRDLIEDLSQELHIREAALARVTSEIEEKKHLASLHEREAAAVDSLVARRMQETAAQQSREDKRSQRRSLLYGSIILAIPVGVLSNFAFEGVKEVIFGLFK